jgi:hypothetical protein
VFCPRRNRHTPVLTHRHHLPSHRRPIHRRLPRSFEKRIFIPLPSLADRRALLGVALRDISLAHGVDLDALAAATEGFSGADVTTLCRTAAMMPIRRLLEAARAGGGGGVDAMRRVLADAGIHDADASQLQLPVEAAHFAEALACTKPSLSGAESARYEAWMAPAGVAAAPSVARHGDSRRARRTTPRRAGVTWAQRTPQATHGTGSTVSHEPAAQLTAGRRGSKPLKNGLTAPPPRPPLMCAVVPPDLLASRSCPHTIAPAAATHDYLSVATALRSGNAAGLQEGGVAAPPLAAGRALREHHAGAIHGRRDRHPQLPARCEDVRQCLSNALVGDGALAGPQTRGYEHGRWVASKTEPLALLRARTLVAPPAGASRSGSASFQRASLAPLILGGCRTRAAAPSLRPAERDGWVAADCAAADCVQCARAG